MPPFSRSRGLLRLLALTLPLVLAALPLASSASAQRQTASLELIADRTAYEPGETAVLAAEVTVVDGWHVHSVKPAQEMLIPTELRLDLPDGFALPALSYPADKAYNFPFESEPVLVYEGVFRIIAEVDLPEELLPGQLEVPASLRYQSCDDRQCLPPTEALAQIVLTIGPGGQDVPDFHTPIAAATTYGVGGGAELAAGVGSAAPSETAAAGAPAAEPGLLKMILLGMLGGLILNAMPCVLPVLSLKVFGLVESAGRGRSHLVTGALATTAGVVLSFWLLAFAAIAASRAGAAVGWGMQFQQPAFVAFLALIMVLFALNMWGLFEIQLPQAAYRLGGSGGGGEGIGSHFASGLFATLMATPCSAPFLGTAVGFALGQPAALVLLMFTAIGIGLALPYLALAAFPAAAKLLPKPGQWMVTFRSVMGFFLAAAAVWLFYVLAGQISAEYLAFLQLALLAVAMFLWLRQAPEGSSGRKAVATAGMVAAAVGTLWLAATAPSAAAEGPSSSKLIEWVAFDEAEASRLTEEGRLVFIDFTAAWCLTCKANERAVIETRPVADVFERHDVVAMKGDWTNRDDRITEFLARYDRAAVPFYILMRPGRDPHVFGEILTQSGLVEAVEQSADQISRLK
ncbi:MAG: thioredoxin family protein [Acidobacteriota bacterium]